MAERPQTSHRPRNAHPDNVLAIRIALLLVGHPLWPLDQSGADPPYRFIYPFHMPTDRVVSRHFVARPRSYVELLCGVAVPYVIFQVLHSGPGPPWSRGTVRPGPAPPAVDLVVLPAMFFWRALAPMLRACRRRCRCLC